MNRSSTIFLQVVIVLIGLGALALLLWGPHVGAEAYFNMVQRGKSDDIAGGVMIGLLTLFRASCTKGKG